MSAAARELTHARVGVDASVLTPVLNEEAHIAQTIAGMRAQRFSGSIEFLLIDGRSTDGTRELIERLTAGDARFRLLDNPRRTTPCALNVGLRAARGEYVVRMDAHTRYPPNYVAGGIERLGRGDVAWVSGPQLAEGADRGSRQVALALSSWLGRGEARFRVAGGEEFDSDAGFCGIWRRQTVERFAGWNEAWPNDQDTEMAARFRAAGERIVCVPELVASYVPRNSLHGLARQYWTYGQYRAKTSRHHPHSLRRSHVLAPGLALALTGAVLAPRRLRRVARGGIGAYASAVTAASVTAAREAPARDAAALPAVFATMHIAWGLGFLAGSLRFGPPLRALAGLLTPGWVDPTRTGGSPRRGVRHDEPKAARSGGSPA